MALFVLLLDSSPTLFPYPSFPLVFFLGFFLFYLKSSFFLLVFWFFCRQEMEIILWVILWPGKRIYMLWKPQQVWMKVLADDALIITIFVSNFALKFCNCSIGGTCGEESYWFPSDWWWLEFGNFSHYCFIIYIIWVLFSENVTWSNTFYLAYGLKILFVLLLLRIIHVDLVHECTNLLFLYLMIMILFNIDLFCGEKDGFSGL